MKKITSLLTAAILAILYNTADAATAPYPIPSPVLLQGPIGGGGSGGSGSQTGPPTSTSIAATQATAVDNSVCTNLVPFYYEIGDKNGAIVSGSVGVAGQYANGTTLPISQNNSVLSRGTVIQATTPVIYASASKWLYGTLVVEEKGGLASLTYNNVNAGNPVPGDVDYLHFESGYTNMGADGTDCEGYDDVRDCLLQTAAYSQQETANIGRFSYDAGHLQNHANNLMGAFSVTVFGSTTIFPLTPTASISIFPSNLYSISNIYRYTNPDMAGGAQGTPNEYALVLRHILNGNPSTTMNGALSAYAVCTNSNEDYSFLTTAFSGVYASAATSSCSAGHTPIPERQLYGLSHWIEVDPTYNGDGAFNSAGSYGTYPWIDATINYYGMLIRDAKGGTITNNILVTQSGYSSETCGRLIRHAFMTGVEQTGTIPTP